MFMEDFKILSSLMWPRKTRSLSGCSLCITLSPKNYVPITKLMDYVSLQYIFNE